MTTSIGWHHPIDQSDQWDGFNEPGIEHFAGSPIVHLAREVNQNSYDSAYDGSVVKVQMRLIHVETASIPNIDELRKTIDLCKIAAPKESPKAEQFFETAAQELSKSKISVLEISDYQTRGMRGPSENGTPFYAFMKAKGQSRKDSDTATGSFGIGKFAPYAVSKLRTVFVSTVYEDAEGNFHQLTQGKSILMSHDEHADRRQGTGFWGIKERCQPVMGISSDLPPWIQRANDEAELNDRKGTKLTILGFDTASGWQESLAVSVAENFFGAINAGKLEVDIDGKYVLDKDTIADFFNNQEIRTVIEKHKNEPDQFDNCSKYLSALQDSPEVIVEESEMLHLGLCQLRILLDEGLPKKVCVLRNGMFISDSLSLAGLKSFSDFKEFVAVVECKTKKGIELLRAMEPPRHDDFEPERLPTKDDQKRGAKALKDLASWVRDMLKRHAKNPVSEVTTLDELKEYFADESGEGEGKGSEEINPLGKIIIRLKPLKPKTEAAKTKFEGEEGAGGEEGEGGGGDGGSGGGDGLGGTGAGDGGTGFGTGGESPKPTVEISNVRAVVVNEKTRRISFTPSTTGQVSIGVMEAGADSDYDIAIASSDIGTVTKGKVIVATIKNSRITLSVGLNENFSGALKVVAHEI
jgi:uncharacterized protein YaiE (UPF0345 family)